MLQHVWNSLPDNLTIQLLTPNKLGGNWSRICSPDIWSVTTLEVLRNLQIDIYLLAHLLNILAETAQYDLFRHAAAEVIVSTSINWMR